MTIAYKTAEELQDESTAELEESIANIEEINRKVRANLDKDKAEEDARAYKDAVHSTDQKDRGCEIEENRSFECGRSAVAGTFGKRWRAGIQRSEMGQHVRL